MYIYIVYIYIWGGGAGNSCGPPYTVHVYSDSSCDNFCCALTSISTNYTPSLPQPFPEDIGEKTSYSFGMVGNFSVDFPVEPWNFRV